MCKESMGRLLYQRYAELAIFLIDSGESIFNYENLRESESKIENTTAIV
jgi:hypothetical protein